jgi:endonuclease/exonuclease/phosphatase family metal-dependent hydrolase
LEERAVVCTLNLWETSRWKERKESLRRFLALHAPDLLCVQELRPESLGLIGEALPGHEHVRDAFPGWTREGNIFWTSARFSLIGHGAEEAGMIEPDRRVFWARLRTRGGAEIVVATAHFTWPGNSREREDGINVRMEQARRTAAVLDRIAPAPAPLLFMGDLNDSGNPVDILKEAGLEDAFSGLGRFPKATRPAAPTYQGAEETLDWMFYRGSLRPMTCEAVDFFHGDFAPSDHKPVLATFAIPDGPPGRLD